MYSDGFQHRVEIEPEQDWESEMTCYPWVVDYQDRTYMFYNGNGYGETGIGWAELRK